ncbi:ABC transporter permease [Bacillus massiliigorillae]|uniref:ABC transporter permease n=1 Tax=Bacillus massiliigorillae TaxID=1243664 RepID=UPI0003A2D5B0|nr:ABC transporter permease [Bacillus massiliigorillae]
MPTAEETVDITSLSKQLKKEQRILRRKRILTNYPLVVGSVLFILLVFIALIGPIVISVDPNSMSVKDRLLGLSAVHPFGTDEFGRDVLARLIYGARVSLLVGLVVAVFSSVFGLIIGLYASYYKLLDHILMRICDGLIAIPGILLAIALMAALGGSALNVIIALTIVFTPSIARTVRSAALVIREQTYIEALQAQGASDSRIIWLHIAPNVLSPLLVQATFIFAEAIISEAALSFLGAGIPAPEPSWGNMLQAGKLVIYKAWWMVVFPGACIFISVLSLNLLGDGLRDFLDPRLKQKPKRWSFKKS